MTDAPSITSPHTHTVPLSTILSHQQYPYRSIPRSNLSPSNISAPIPTSHLPPPSSTIRTHHHHRHHIPSSNHQYTQPSYTPQPNHHPQYPTTTTTTTTASLPTFPTLLSSQSSVPRHICNPVTTQPPLSHHPQISSRHSNFSSAHSRTRPHIPQQPTKYRRLETTTHVTNLRRMEPQLPAPTHIPPTGSPFNYPILSSPPPSRYDPVPARDDGYSTGSRETAPAPDALEDEHDVEAPFTCAHCAARFTDREQRKNHIKTAHEKPFVCVACNSRFTRKFDLEKHSLTVHEGMRPFQCDICPMSFGQKHHLVRHKRSVHAKARDFACDSCTSRFARKEHLGNHKRAVHEKHKPYMCSLCDVQYYERRALRNHLEQVHSVKSSRSSTLAEWQPNGNDTAPSIQELVQM